MIDPHTLETLARRVTTLGFCEAGIATVRAQFKELRLTFCLEDDMGMAEPYREYGDFNLYLVQAGGHCLTLTDQPGQAAGVVVAEMGGS